MPELPEVETIQRYLSLHLVKEKIDNLQVNWAGSVVVTEPANISLLHNQHVQAIRRRGKYLLCELDDFDMVIHLRMTGQIYFNPVKPPKDHVHWILKLSDEKFVYYRDVRKFGRLYLTKKGHGLTISGAQKIGPEPWKITLKYWQDKLKSKRSIKGLILDQEVIAGIGNIYADEALFLAKIHPETQSNNISPEKAEELLKAIRTVLDKGIRYGGTSFRDYIGGDGKKGDMQAHLQVYQKTGQTCPICGDIITRIKVGGRSSHFCPSCQRI